MYRHISKLSDITLQHSSSSESASEVQTKSAAAEHESESDHESQVTSPDAVPVQPENVQSPVEEPHVEVITYDRGKDLAQGVHKLLPAFISTCLLTLQTKCGTNCEYPISTGQGYHRSGG